MIRATVEAGASRGRRRGDRGSADALGLALIAPAALGLALAIVAVGRQVDARATAHSAAEAAAQAAAGERDPASATARARQLATSMLTDDRTCADPQVTVDVSRFGPGGVVAVTVACTADSTDLAMTGATATTYRTTAFATIDPFRAVEGS